MTNLKMLETYARGGKKMRGRHRRLASGHLIDAAADAAGCRLCPQTEVSRAFLARTTSGPPPPPRHQHHHGTITERTTQAGPPPNTNAVHLKPCQRDTFLMHDHLHRRNLSIFFRWEKWEPHFSKQFSVTVNC